MFSLVKKTLLTFALLGAMTTTTLAGEAVRFEIEAPTMASLGETIDVTVKAVDTDGNVDAGYQGSIVLATDYIGDDISTAWKTLKFTDENAGVYKIEKGITFKTLIGDRQINVIDVNGNNITGSVKIQIEKEKNEEEKKEKTEKKNTEPKTETTKKPLIIPMNTQNPWMAFHMGVANMGFVWKDPIINQYLGFTSGTVSALDRETYIDQNVKYELCLQEILAEETLENEKDMSTLKMTAKKCAKQAYGTYFNGKSYTTREEVLLLLNVYFDTKVYLTGIFTETSFVALKNKNQKWYTPFIEKVKSDNQEWKVAKEISDEEAFAFFNMYKKSDKKKSKTEIQLKNKYENIFSAFARATPSLKGVQNTAVKKEAPVVNTPKKEEVKKEEIAEIINQTQKKEENKTTTQTQKTEKKQASTDKQLSNLLSIYKEINSTYPRALDELVGIPFFNNKTGQYEVITQEDVNKFKTQFNTVIKNNSLTLN